MLVFFNIVFLWFLIIPISIAMEIVPEEEPINVLNIITDEEFDAEINTYILTGDIPMISNNKKQIFKKKRNVALSNLASRGGYEELSKALSGKWRWTFTLIALLKYETKKINKIKKALFDGATGGNLYKIEIGLKAARKKHIDGAKIINYQGKTPVDVAEENYRNLMAIFIKNYQNLARVNNKKFPSEETIKEDISDLRRISKKYSSSMILSIRLKDSPPIKRKKRGSPSPEKRKKAAADEITEEVVAINHPLARKQSNMPRKKRNGSPSPENVRRALEKLPTHAEINKENLKINQKLVLRAYSSKDFSKINEDVLSHEVFEKLIEKNQVDNFEDTMLKFIMLKHNQYKHWNKKMWSLLIIKQLTKSLEQIDQELKKCFDQSYDYRRVWFLSIIPKGFKDTDLLLNANNAAERARKIGQEALAMALEEQRYMLLFDIEKLSTAVCNIALQREFPLY